MGKFSGLNGIITLCMLVFVLSIFFTFIRLIYVKTKKNNSIYDEEEYEKQYLKKKSRRNEKEIPIEILENLINHFEEKAKEYEEKGETEKMKVMIDKMNSYKIKYNIRSGINRYDV